MIKKILPAALSIFFYGIAFIAIVITIVKRSVNSKNKYKKLHTGSIAALVLGFILLSVFSINALNNIVNRKTETSESTATADGFTIEEYRVVMDVNEANSIDVKEYIIINFYEEGHHGIYRFIPSWLEYTNKEGITQSRQSKIKNLKVVGENYTIDTVKGKQRIKIGDAAYTLPTGPHIYEIDYTYDMGYDPYTNYDEFIFHAFGNYWGTEIKNASITITLPKEFDSNNKIKFFSDKYRKEDISSYVNYHVSGNTIYANLSQNYNLYNALTIDVELPDNYFINGSNNYGHTSLILCLACIIFAVISFILWAKNGKDLDKVPETVEFYPPENLDAAEIGYLYKKDTGSKLAIATLIELASKGYIKIMESDDKKTQTIIKTCPTDINKYIKREIKITKLKDYKENYLNKNYKASKIMNEYFSGDIKENVVTSDFDDFYKDSKYLVDKGYLKIESDTINEYSKEQLEQIQKKLDTNETKDKPKMSSNEEIVYNKLFETSDETVLSENTSFYLVFSEIADNVRNTFDDKINDLTSYKYMLITSIGFIVCTILWALAFCKYEDLDPKLNIIYFIAYASNIIIAIFSILMKRKNSYGEQLEAKIKGFKNYIELAEKNQIDMLVEENPQYFYNILPYAYVLDVSKKWIKKFENIPIPVNDMGNFDYTNLDALDSLSDSIYIPSSSSGGCSSCGGGCSSCGGGCSSCGGGGSW